MSRFRVIRRPNRHIFHPFQNVPASCERSHVSINMTSSSIFATTLKKSHIQRCCACMPLCALMYLCLSGGAIGNTLLTIIFINKRKIFFVLTPACICNNKFDSYVN